MLNGMINMKSEPTDLWFGGFSFTTIGRKKVLKRMNRIIHRIKSKKCRWRVIKKERKKRNVGPIKGDNRKGKE